MLKKICILSFALIILMSFCSCTSSKNDNETTSEPTVFDDAFTDDDVLFPEENGVTEQGTTDDTVSTTKNTSATKNNATEKKPVVTTTAPNITVETPSTESVTYYSENPNNRYIQAVAKKYGKDPSTIIALIRVNSQTPGATVLQFTGERDENGELIKNENTLKYVYDVRDDGTIKKASGKKTDNDGYTHVESYINYNLAIKYLIPQLDDMKRERTYEDFYSN